MSSAKRRELAAQPIRKELLESFPACMVCGACPGKPHRNLPSELSSLSVHEIHSGSGNRNKCLDKLYGLLVLCWLHNQEMTDRKKWPESRQLAVLKQKAPDNYDLVAYNAMVNVRAPNRITTEEVNQWVAL